MRKLLFFLTFVSLSACGIDTETPTQPPVTHTLTWAQSPTTEIQTCHTFRLDNDRDLELSRLRVSVGQGSHHVHVYRSTTPELDGVVDCWTGIDWTRWQLVIGAQTSTVDWTLPEGLTMPLRAHEQLLVQVHWINGEEIPVNPRADLAFWPADEPGTHVGVLFGINKRVHLEQGEHKTITSSCPIPDGSKVIGMMGHYHGLGVRYEIKAGEQMLYEAGHDSQFKFETHDDPIVLPPSTAISFSCEFFNYRSHPIEWSADVEKGEHCNMVAYYYPAEGASYCITEP